MNADALTTEEIAELVRLEREQHEPERDNWAILIYQTTFLKLAPRLLAEVQRLREENERLKRGEKLALEYENLERFKDDC